MSSKSEQFRQLNTKSDPYILMQATIKIRPEVRDLMKHECRKDQTYSDYVLELIQYKKEKERSHE